MEKSITELLVRPQIAFETIPGHYTGETKFRTGLCDTHKRSVAASNHVDIMSRLAMWPFCSIM